MSPDEMLEVLRAKKGRLSPVELAELLNIPGGPGLKESTLVMFFKLAFPEIPLGLLRKAGLWHRVSRGGKSDEWLNEILGSWLKPEMD